MNDFNEKEQPENPGIARSVGEIIDNFTLLVHDEIELAKAEVAQSAQNLLRGSVAGVLGGVFAFFGLFIFLIGISFLINDALDFGNWPGFLIVAFMLFFFGAIAAVFALRKIKKGSHIAPTKAIAEARLTQAALQAHATPADDPTVGIGGVGDVVVPAAAPAPIEVPPSLPVASPAGPSKSELKQAEKARKQAAKAEAKANEAAAKAAAQAKKAADKAQKQADKDAAKAAKSLGKSKDAEPKDGGDQANEDSDAN